MLLASASNAIIIGFNVRPDRNAADVAEREEVDIRLHSVIYNVTDEIKKAMAGLLDPTFKEVRLGTAEVREVFKVPKIGAIAGCMVTDGPHHARRRHAGAAAARQRRRPRRQDRLAAPLQGRRQRSEVRLRVRHRPRPATTTSRSATSSKSFTMERVTVGDACATRVRCRTPVRDRLGSTSGASASNTSLHSMAQGHRPDRVGEQIREELSALLSRGEVHDPGIGFITLTRVKVIARPAGRARVLHLPRRREGAARRRPRRSSAPRRSCAARSAARLSLRRVPEIEFRFDESIAHQDRIEQILRDLHEEEAQRAAAAATPPGRPEIPTPTPTR